MTGAVPKIRGADFPTAAFREDYLAHSFLGRRMMIVSRPAAVHHILVENHANYVRPAAAHRILEPPIGGGLFLAEGAEWRRQRALLAPSFTPRAVPDFARHVVRETALLLDELAAAVGRDVDLFRPLQKLVLAIAAAAMFAIDIRNRDGEEMTALSFYYSERLGRPGMLDFLLPRSVPGPRDFLRRRFRRRWMALIGRIIAKRRDQAADPPGLFELLQESEEERGLFAQQVATMLITGSETTGAATFWSVYLLAGAPEVQERIAAEAEGLDLRQEDAAAALARLVYTRAAVQEAMRLYPPAFSIVRQPLADDVADGIPVPAGAIVQTAPWVLHRHERLWDDPAAFRPERFLPGAPAPERGSYIPFGIGPRQCIGAQVALVEAALVIAMLVRAFRIEPTTGRPVRPVARITLQPDNPAPFRLRPRGSARQ